MSSTNTSKKALKQTSKSNAKKKHTKSPTRKQTSKASEINNNMHLITSDNINDADYVNDYRQIINDYNINNNKSEAVLTDYEYSLIVGKRATQIAYGAEPLIDITKDMDYIQIAEEEVKQKKVPFMIRRTVGSNIEYWKIEDLEVNC